MRILLALLLPLILAAAPARDWSTVATKQANGAYLIGNPAAPVKLVEYGSYTCPHCGAFSVESGPVLRGRLIRSGKVSLEYRHYVRDSADLAAALVARCAGPKGFAATSDRIFATQRDWLPRAADWSQANAERMRMYPAPARLRAEAEGAGLLAIGRTAGLTDARLDACLADEAEADRLVAMTAAAPPSVVGTPSFLLNGRAVPGASWSAIQPALAAAGAR
ncbi:Thioredoxin [Sphingomonas gellani]|uniref:Thioredoxin n=1 Tax=Sphingomonas gellani TaxID=1166340 RepID=A0A1H8C9N7_9SPHN|nr:thioredoxin domain-containing protein [Sphingomonas gellani]SEM90968.1 Thioredoxin [Sphingomonas gellani]